MSRITAFAALVMTLAAPAAFAQEPALAGLWIVISLDNLTTGQKEASHRQYHMFTEAHHMIALAGEGRPKISKSFSDMTPEEVRSQQPVGAGLYSYSRQGAKLIRTNILALSAFYEGKTFETEFEFKADTLILRDRHAAGGDLRQWTLERVQ